MYYATIYVVGDLFAQARSACAEIGGKVGVSRLQIDFGRKFDNVILLAKPRKLHWVFIGLRI